MDNYLATREVAKMLNVAPRTINNLVSRGELPAIRVGKILRIREADVKDFIARGGSPINEGTND